MKSIHFPPPAADEAIRGLLANRKTATRRVVKPRYFDSVFEMFRGQLCEASPHKPPVDNGDGTTTRFVRNYVHCKQPYLPGDILYVREAFFEHKGHFYYKADGKHEALARLGIAFKWRPSIYMPREAARIFLRVTDVRVERLKDITEDQAQAEGLHKGWTLTDKSTPASTAKQAFMWVWDMTIKPSDRSLYGWIGNPWVWVIEFERISKEEAENHGN